VNEVTISRLAVLAVACMLIGASGGVSFLISALGLREIRAWNRISIVIAFLTVIGLAMAIDRIGRWLQRRWAPRPARARWAPTAVAALVVLVAFVDQGGNDAPAYATAHAKFASDRAFFAVVRDRLGSGAAVFNLPYQPFPEAPPRNGVGEFELAAGYIYEPSLNWSFGAMRGRVPDYQKVLETQPTDEWMTSVAAIGFTGIVVDRLGYTPAELTAEESEIAAIVGPPTLSVDGHYSFFDLRSFANDVRQQLGESGVRARAEQTLALRSGASP
jgi:phosphoglycerol transferase